MLMRERKSIVREPYIGFRAMATQFLSSMTGLQLRWLSRLLLPSENPAVSNGAFSGQHAGFVFISAKYLLLRLSRAASLLAETCRCRLMLQQLA